jgi:hypothetical protein
MGCSLLLVPTAERLKVTFDRAAAAADAVRAALRRAPLGRSRRQPLSHATNCVIDIPASVNVTRHGGDIGALTKTSPSPRR